MPAVNSNRYPKLACNALMGSIGRRIVALRKQRGLSQTALAKLVGIRQPSLLANIENGKTQALRGDTLAGLCRVLQVPPDAILKGDQRQDKSAAFEREMIALLMAMPDEAKEHVLAIARALTRH